MFKIIYNYHFLLIEENWLPSSIVFSYILFLLITDTTHLILVRIVNLLRNEKY